MKIFALATLALLVSGCATTSQQSAHTAIPVECRETVPDRPVMPTETLTSSGLDAFVQAATAEIERREGYEKLLRTALVACTAPLNKGTK